MRWFFPERLPLYSRICDFPSVNILANDVQAVSFQAIEDDFGTPQKNENHHSRRLLLSSAQAEAVIRC